MKNFYFVRHALSQDNKRGVFSSTNDCKLAPEGVEQAIAAGKKLKGVGIDLIISSPLLRAVHTAELIAEQIGVDKNHILTTELLAERDLGSLEGTPYPAPKPVHHYPEVESFEDLLERCRAAYEWIKKQGADNVLVVSHGATGRALRKIVDPKSDTAQKLGNAEIEKWL